MKDYVPVGLGHLGVDVVAGVAQLRDLLGPQLHPLCGVVEGDTLVYLQFSEECVEAAPLLTFLGECIVLGYTLQRQLIHQVNFVRVLQVLPHESLDREWDGGSVEPPSPGQYRDLSQTAPGSSSSSRAPLWHFLAILSWY